MGKSNVELIAIAKKYLGHGGSEFRKYCGLPSGAPYCDAYITTIFAKSDDASLFCNGAKQTYCPTTLKLLQKTLASIPPYLALEGDVLLFDWELNGIPNHIGFVTERKSCDEIYTIEGNTSKLNSKGQVVATGVVAERTRTTKYVQGIFRPHFKPTAFDPNKALVIDGLFGYNSIAITQKALKAKGLYNGDIDAILGQGTVKAIQKLCGATADGLWGKATSKALQKFLGVKQDGLFGKDSTKALQKWANAQVFPQQVTKTNAQKLGEKANELAYASAPAEAKYPSGHAKAAYKTALEKVYPNRSSWGKAPKAGASCDVFVGTCVRASGIDADFPRGLAEQWPYLAKSKKFTCALNLTSRNLKASDLKDGDIITYCYSKGGGHILIYYKGKLKHADVNDWYGRTTTEGGRFKIKGKKWIKVYRAK